MKSLKEITTNGSARPVASVTDHSATVPAAEWSAEALRPIAHWVLMPSAGGGSQLRMVWEVPDPIPLSQSR